MPIGYAGSIMHPWPSPHILYVTPRSPFRVPYYHHAMVIPVWTGGILTFTSMNTYAFLVLFV